MADSDKGFLGRWSQRKAALAQGKVLEEAAVPVPKADLAAADPLTAPPTQVPPASASCVADEPLPTPPALTLADARELTKDSDFKPFMAGNVTADVRNAAMKKLFADPQFNVMDGLDIYIDDYSVFEPIPESMLRQMVSAKFLNLFPDEDDTKAAVTPPPVLTLDNATAPEIDALSDAAPLAGTAPVPELPAEPGQLIPLATTATATPDDHDHSYLRLQPNHAATGPATGRGT